MRRRVYTIEQTSLGLFEQMEVASTNFIHRNSSKSQIFSQL